MIVTKVPRQVFHTIVSLFILLLVSSGHAQITLDGSMGTAGALSGPNFVIPSAVGQTRGSNLFHSFGLFNVLTNQSATFTGPHSISNIFGRVTGGQTSVIDGLLRSTISNANLYLMNPAGVIFGPNSVLNLPGSFHVTTADYLKFADGAKFHADLSRQSRLTTAPVSAFGFLSQNPAGILVQQTALQTQRGTMLSLVGGDIDIIGDPFLTTQGAPTLSTFGGNLQIASVASPGDVPQNVQDLNPNTFERMGSITLSNAAYLDVSNYFGGLPGNVVIRGGRFSLDNSFIFALNSGSASGLASALDIQVSGAMSVTNGSLLTTDSFGTGRAANLQISADTLEIIDDSKIRSNVFASGDGGDLRVNARSFTLSNGAEISTDTRGAGNSGNLFVAAGNLTLAGESNIASDNSATGNGGNIQLNVAETLTLAGISLITGSAQPGSTGDAGNITIEAKNLGAFGGSQIFGGTFGTGKGGTTRVIVSEDIRLDGIGGMTRDGLPRASGIASGANPGSTGAAGNLVIEARNLAVTGDAEISSSTFGAGDGGNINLSASNTIIVDGSGQAGPITINSGIVAINQPGSTGNAGNIVLDTMNLTMTGGARLATRTFGPGNGGTIHLTASDTISIDGRDHQNVATIIAGGSGPGNTGNPGDILLEARNVIVTGGATISSDTAGSKNGGTVRIIASELIRVDGIGAFLVNGTDVRTSAVSASSLDTSTGNGGDVLLQAKNVIVHGAQISSGAAGDGNGGTVRIIAADTIELGGFGFALSEDLIVRGGVFASNQPGSTGKAGDIILGAGKVNLFGAGVSTETFNDKAAGTIAVTGNTVTLKDGSAIKSASAGSGNAGDIFIQANEVRMKDSSITTQANFADGGNIHLKVGKLVELVNSQIITSVQGGAGAGGNILIDPQFVVLNNSVISANAFGGPGGNIIIIADNFIASADSSVAASSALSTPGTVDIQAPITDLSGSLAPLPESIVQATSLLRQSCAARYSSGKLSTLASPGRGGMPFEPGGFMPSSIADGDVGRRIADASTSGWLTLAETGKRHFSISATCGS